MMRIAVCVAPVLAIACALAIAGVRPACADSAQLQWQYECLENPDAVCYDATPSGTDPLPPPASPRPAAPASEEATPAATVIPTASVPPKNRAVKPPANGVAKAVAGGTPPSDPFAAIAARLQARKPTEADMTTLRTRATAGNGRALNLLAWAELVGVGAPRDPVQAYFVYGMAAAAGVPTGRRDQAAIFEGALTADERQQILVIENGDRAHERQ